MQQVFSSLSSKVSVKVSRMPKTCVHLEVDYKLYHKDERKTEFIFSLSLRRHIMFLKQIELTENSVVLFLLYFYATYMMAIHLYSSLFVNFIYRSIYC